ncbi:MAG: FIST C-terminal domain-containing protein [Deltaproteobacteria bacterium]|nr:FIST C-terminal domain-containing protein [Deltaproteobacteria bacterium]
MPEPADVMIVFASPTYDHAVLLQALTDTCKPVLLVGSSSAGEFTSEMRGEGLACALALRSDTMKFAAGVGRGLTKDRTNAAHEIVSSFNGLSTYAYPYRTALVMTDALAGHADDLVSQLTLATSGKYQFFGGGAGDNAQFRRTNVFFGTEALTDAAVALEILSTKPIGIGVGHGWEPAGEGLRVTEARGMTVFGLNGMPAVDAFAAHARATNQQFDPAAPLPFFLHNIVGIDTGAGFQLRVPLAVSDDGAVTCASEVPVGAKVHIMRTTQSSAVEAAARATSSAISALGEGTPKVALFFDCVATRLRMGDEFAFELDALGKLLGPANFMGCNTHGQIARADGQFGGFHNCTAVVCILPE